MAHEVERMFYVGKEPWHGLGTRIPEEKRLSVAEGSVAAGLDWEVTLRHVFAEGSSGDPTGIINKEATYLFSGNVQIVLCSGSRTENIIEMYVSPRNP
jgi:hypothetical protein